MHYLYHSKTIVSQQTDQSPYEKEDSLNKQLQNTEPRLFPPVNTGHLHASAKEYESLLADAKLLIEKIINSSSFAEELMHEAQLSNQQKVDELIASIGMTIKVNTNYSPSGIHFELFSQRYEQGCCLLDLKLRW